MIRPALKPFAPLPRVVMRRTDLCPAAKLVFAALADLPPRKDDNRVRASYRKLAQDTGLSRSTVIRAIDELRLRTLIEADFANGRRGAYDILLTPDMCQIETGPPVSKRDRTGVKLIPHRYQNDTPARVTALSTALTTPRGVPPLVWVSAVERLKSTYAEAFGDGAAPPNRWHAMLADELRAGNMALANDVTAADMRRGVQKAKAKERPFGFGWVVLAFQERQINAACGPTAGHGQTKADVQSDESLVVTQQAIECDRRQALAAWAALDRQQRSELISQQRFGGERIAMLTWWARQKAQSGEMR